jgi:hypothetical protein
MIRRLLTLMAALSLLLCVATCVPGVRSYWYISFCDSTHYWNTDGRGHRYSYQAMSYQGGLVFRHDRLWIDNPAAVGMSRTDVWKSKRGEGNTTGKWNGRYAGFIRSAYLGFGFWRSKSADSGPKLSERSWTIAVPYWGIATLLAFPPAAWLLVLRRARKAAFRLRHVRCMYCGYDLRASRDRCLECGGMAPEQSSCA